MSDSYPPSPPPPPAGGGKHPILILLVNFAGACAGYWLIGQRSKAVAGLVLWIIGVFPPMCGTVSMLIGLIAAIDGYLQAAQLQAGRPIGPWTFFSRHA